MIIGKKNQSVDNKVWVSGAIKSVNAHVISKPSNILLWLLALAVVVLGVAGTEYMGAISSTYLSSIAVVTVLVALVIARFTNQGRKFWSFLMASKLEMAKVVWPTRKETLTMSGMVIVVVMIFSFFIYLFGLFFGKFIQYFLS